MRRQIREAEELPSGALVTPEGGRPVPVSNYAGRQVKWTRRTNGMILVMLDGPVAGARGNLVYFEDGAVYEACVGFPV